MLAAWRTLEIQLGGLQSICIVFSVGSVQPFLNGKYLLSIFRPIRKTCGYWIAQLGFAGLDGNLYRESRPSTSSSSHVAITGWLPSDMADNSKDVTGYGDNVKEVVLTLFSAEP